MKMLVKKPEKLLVIVSRDKDYSAQKLTDWCFYFGVDVCVLNNLNRVSKVYIKDLNSIQLETNYSFTKFISSEVNLYYRNGEILFDIKNSLRGRYTSSLLKEIDKLLGFINEKNNFSKTIGLGGLQLINKLNILAIAYSLGLNIPHTSIVMNSEKEFKQDMSRSKNYITKNIDEAILEVSKKNYIYNRTTKFSITNVKIDFPTLIQESVDKKFELRIFFLKGKFFSCAIFSQNDNQTKTDFRNYNYNKPNRFVPYKLNRATGNKLRKLMSFLNLDTGSIDMIVDKKGNEYFLEVNPNGQYSMISEPCNFNLEKEILLSFYE